MVLPYGYYPAKIATNLQKLILLQANREIPPLADAKSAFKILLLNFCAFDGVITYDSY